MSLASSPNPLPLRALRISLMLGAFVDISGGIGLVVRPEATATWFGVPVVGHLIFWPMYAAVFMFVLPMFYFVTALNPTRMLANVGVSIAGRIMGAATYLIWYVPLGRPNALFGMVLLNLAFASFYFWVLKPEGRVQLRAALRLSDER